MASPIQRRGTRSSGQAPRLAPEPALRRRTGRKPKQPHVEPMSTAPPQPDEAPVPMLGDPRPTAPDLPAGNIMIPSDGVPAINHAKRKTPPENEEALSEAASRQLEKLLAHRDAATPDRASRLPCQPSNPAHSSPVGLPPSHSSSPCASLEHRPAPIPTHNSVPQDLNPFLVHDAAVPGAMLLELPGPLDGFDYTDLDAPNYSLGQLPSAGEMALLDLQPQMGATGLQPGNAMRELHVISGRNPTKLLSYTPHSKHYVEDVQSKLLQRLLTNGAFPEKHVVTTMINDAWAEKQREDLRQMFAINSSVITYLQSTLATSRGCYKAIVMHTVKEQYGLVGMSVDERRAWVAVHKNRYLYIYREVVTVPATLTTPQQLVGRGIPFGHTAIPAILEVIAFAPDRGPAAQAPNLFRAIPLPLLAFAATLIHNALDTLEAPPQGKPQPLTTSRYEPIYASLLKYAERVATAPEHCAAMEDFRRNLWFRLRDFARINEEDEIAMDFLPD